MRAILADFTHPTNKKRPAQRPGNLRGVEQSKSRVPSWIGNSLTLISWSELCLSASRHSHANFGNRWQWQSAGDPVATGLVESRSCPGGNITRTSGIAAEVASKNVELLREIIPSLSRLAVLINSADPFARPFLSAVEGSTSRLSIELERVEATSADELDPILRKIQENGADAVVVQPTLLQTGLAELFLKCRLPSASVALQFPKSGGLMSYSANSPALGDKVRRMIGF
ncbi:ABC transporter substrate binding protein [Bradyrhizobium sp. OAE829]|uniref:ABC transporter substrate binding protein n=1 Tax=Bradyrhizobium sp. OAE829 TaxID=2663807 RepID=UPI003399B216